MNPTSPALLVPGAVDAYEAALHDAVRRVASHLRSVTCPSSGPCVTSTRQTVSAVDLDGPAIGLQPALDELGPLYLDSVMHFHDPRYAAHLNCPVSIPSLVAELLISALNTSMDTWDQSGAATHVEQALVDWTCARLGLLGGDGVMTPGGTLSNLQALLLARGEALDAGAPPQRMKVLVGAHGHFSIGKACHQLGLADDAVVRVPLDGRGRISPLGLSTALRRAREAGDHVTAVVATAGTTDLGLVDPLREIGTVCADAGVWFHVDAAYGGGLMTSRRHRHLLDGTELASSVTVDYHKTFFVPISASALLVADPHTLRHVTHHADYLNPRGSGVPNLVDKSLQTTRRFDALKVWLTLRALGADAIGEMLDQVVNLAGRTADEIQAAEDLELHSRPTLSTVVFRAFPDDAAARSRLLTDTDLANAVVRRTRRILLDEGRSIVAGTTLDGLAHLKLTLLNPAATDEDMRAVLTDVRDAARRAHAAVLSERGPGAQEVSA